jgi:hypothetical protein
VTHNMKPKGTVDRKTVLRRKIAETAPEVPTAQLGAIQRIMTTHKELQDKLADLGHDFSAQEKQIADLDKQVKMGKRRNNILSGELWEDRLKESRARGAAVARTTAVNSGKD